MRSATEIRAAKLETLGAMLARPSMWGWGAMYEMAVRDVLHDLAFIDEREATLKLNSDHLHLFNSTGVHGTLARFDDDERCVTERTASVYARVAAQLGYYRPSRRLTQSEWARATRGAVRWARQAPRTITDVELRFGTPSYTQGSPWPGVLAYVGPDDEAWLYFDIGRDCRLEFIRLPRRPRAPSVIDLRTRPEANAPQPRPVAGSTRSKKR